MIQIGLTGLDRAIFETIRLAVVAKGWYPDVTTIQTEEELEQAKNTMRDSGVELVEPLGVGSWPSKDEKTVSKVVLLRKQLVKDGLGGDHCYFYAKVDGGVGNFFYRKYAYPNAQKTVMYELRLICNTTERERELLEMVGECFHGGGRQMNPIQGSTWDVTKTFKLNVGTAIDITGGRMMEWMIPLQAGPVWLDAPRLIQDNIPPFTHIGNATVVSGVITTPDVNREHVFDADGNYELQEGEQFVGISRN